MKTSTIKVERNGLQVYINTSVNDDLGSSRYGTVSVRRQDNVDRWGATNVSMDIEDISSDRLAYVWLPHESGKYTFFNLVFDWYNRTVWVEERYNGDNAHTESAAHGLRDDMPLPQRTDASKLLPWLLSQEIQRLMRRAIDGVNVSYDEVNDCRRSHATDDAIEAIDALDRILTYPEDHDFALIEDGGPISAAEFLDDLETFKREDIMCYILHIPGTGEYIFTSETLAYDIECGRIKRVAEQVDLYALDIGFRITDDVERAIIKKIQSLL